MRTRTSRYSQGLLVDIDFQYMTNHRGDQLLILESRLPKQMHILFHTGEGMQWLQLDMNDKSVSDWRNIGGTGSQMILSKLFSFLIAKVRVDMAMRSKKVRTGFTECGPTDDMLERRINGICPGEVQCSIIRDGFKAHQVPEETSRPLRWCS